jgi:hypothetical protein
MKKLSQKHKDILVNPLSSPWALQALFNVDDYYIGYTEKFDAKGFSEQNGFTVKQAQAALDALATLLNN